MATAQDENSADPFLAGKAEGFRGFRRNYDPLR
jgi:hypothetical protein